MASRPVRIAEHPAEVGTSSAVVLFANDEAFLSALRARHTGAVALFFDRYERNVDRVLTAVLGPDAEIPDLVQEVFTRALGSLPSFRGDTTSLPAWLNRIAVFTARGLIRRRRRRWWFRLDRDEALEQAADAGPDPTVVEALRRAYRVLDRLPETERVAFVLRHIDQMELTDVADACAVSLSTIKRRLTRARARFERLAALDPLLVEWLAGDRRPS